MTNDSSGWTVADLTGTKASRLDPLLGPLQDNGGPTQTMALLPGSPAIDAGDNASSPGPNDQRGNGFARIVDGTTDIGAFEVQGGGENAAPARGRGPRVAHLGPNDRAMALASVNSSLSPSQAKGILQQSVWAKTSPPTHQLFPRGFQQGFNEQDARDAFFSTNHADTHYMDVQDLTTFTPGLRSELE